MLTLRFLTVEEDEASPTYDPGVNKDHGQVRGDGGIEGGGVRWASTAVDGSVGPVPWKALC